MASAKQCDRCEVFYAVSSLSKCGKVLLYKRQLLHSIEVDLCPKCLKSLQEWYKHTEQTNDNTS